MKSININPKKALVFNLKAREQCKSCKRYNSKSSCPPHIDNIDYYMKLLTSYKYGIIYYENFIASQEEWEKISKESSLVMSKHLLKVRDELFNSGYYFVNGYGSGSCKVCAECSFPCRFPNQSLVPMEGTGIDVVATMKNFDINIKFPIDKSFYRVGLIVYE